MILINLLPHRELARKQRRESFYVALALAAVLGLVVSGLWYLWYQAELSTQTTKNDFLIAENQRLDKQIADIKTLKAEIAALRARQQAVEDLQADRNQPVSLLNEMSKQMPDGVYLTAVRQDNQTLTLQGVAQSNERVSEVLRNLSNRSPWVTKPELVEIVASTMTLGREQRRVANFTMRASLVRSSEVKPADGPAKPAPGG